MSTNNKTRTYVVARLLTGSDKEARAQSGLVRANKTQQNRYERAKKMMAYDSRTLSDELERYLYKQMKMRQELSDLNMLIKATEDAIEAKKTGF